MKIRTERLIASILLIAILVLAPFGAAQAQSGKINSITLRVIGPDNTELTQTHYRYNFSVELLKTLNATTGWISNPVYTDDDWDPATAFFSNGPFKEKENKLVGKTFDSNDDVGLQVSYLDNTLDGVAPGLHATRLIASRGGERLCFVKKLEYSITGGTTKSGVPYEYDPSGEWYDHKVRTCKISDLQDRFFGYTGLHLNNNNLDYRDYSIPLKGVTGDIDVELTVYLAKKPNYDFKIEGLTGTEIYLYSWSMGYYLRSSTGDNSGSEEAYKTTDPTKIKSVGQDYAKLKLNINYSVWENTVILIKKMGKATKRVVVDGYKNTPLDALLIGEVTHAGNKYWAVIAGPNMGSIRPGDGTPPPPMQHKISYKENGSGYSLLKVHEGNTLVPPEGTVENGKTITITVTPDKCKKVSSVLVNMNGQSKEYTSSPFKHIVTAPVSSITPILETKNTKVSWRAENTSVTVNNGSVSNNSSVPCGTTLQISVSPSSACNEFTGQISAKIDGVAIVPAPTMTLANNVYTCTIEASGDELSFEAIATTKNLSVNWTPNTNYTLTVNTTPSGPVSIPCGNEVTIEATSKSQDRPIEKITVTYDDDQTEDLPLSAGKDANSKKGVISSLSRNIKEITVSLAVPPNIESIVYQQKGDGYELKVFDHNNKPLTSGSPLVLNKPIKIEVHLTDQCYSFTNGKVVATYKGGATPESFPLTGNSPFTTSFPARHSIVSIDVTLNRKAYKITPQSTNLTIEPPAGHTLDDIPCGSILKISVNPPECQEVDDFLVNDLPANPKLPLSADGKHYEFTVTQSSALNVLFKDKTIMASWNSPAEYTTTLTANSTGVTSGSSIPCGTPVTVEVKSTDTDRSISSVTVQYDNGLSDSFTASDFETLNSEGSHIKFTIARLKHNITGITANLNSAPQKFTVTYEAESSDHSLVVTQFNSGTPVQNGLTVRENTKIGIKVEIKDKQRNQVHWVKVNQKEITDNYDEVAGMYYFTITANSDIQVKLSPRLYNVKYTKPSDCELEVRIGSATGEKIPAGKAQGVPYETTIFVKALVNPDEGTFVQKYTYNINKEIVTQEEDGWYSFKVTEEIQSIGVQLRTLGNDECLVNYTQNYKDTVWRKVGNDYEVEEVTVATVTVKYAGRILEEKNEIVPKNAELDISITIKHPEKFHFTCLTVKNRIVTITLENDGTYRLKIEKLSNIIQKLVTIDAWFARKAKASDNAKLFYLIVNEPRHGDLEVRRKGLKPLLYNQTYHASPEWEYEVTLKPEDGFKTQNSCPDLQEHLSASAPFSYQISPDREERRINLWVTYSPKTIGYNVEYSATEGGKVIATDLSGAEIPENSVQQKWIRLKFAAQADEGFYLDRFEFNGTNVLQATPGKADKNLRKFSYQQDIVEDLKVRGFFKKNASSAPSHDEPTPVQHSLLNNLTPFPNPTQGIVYIRDASPITHYLLTDLNGRILKQSNHDQSEQLMIDLSKLAPGLYLIHLTSERNQSRSIRVIKQ